MNYVQMVRALTVLCRQRNLALPEKIVLPQPAYDAMLGELSPMIREIGEPHEFFRRVTLHGIIVERGTNE